MAELALRVDHLTSKHLEDVLDALFLPPRPDVVTFEYLLFGLATEVLRFFFGDEWTDENVFPVQQSVSKHNERGRSFLRTDSPDRNHQFRYMQRVINLAEITFNLQEVEGIDERIELMEKHDLESALGELECAALLARPDLKLRFVTPTGTFGLDYEAEVTTCSNRKVCCEIKAKSETTHFDSQTLWGTLDKARKQLPKNEPGLVLLRIPEPWVEQTNVQQGVEDAIERVFRQSQRLIGVLLVWEKWQDTPNEGTRVETRFRCSPNEKSKFYREDITELIGVLGRASNKSWLSFKQFVLRTLSTN